MHDYLRCGILAAMKRQTRQDYHTRINRVVAAILADPSAEHSVETLAAIAALSPFHFHRIYRAMTGEGVAETVRRIRLARAAHALGETNETVIQIALDAGYQSPPAFARAFRQFAGLSPSAFQTDRKAFGAPERDGCISFVTMPKLRLICLRHEGPVETIAHTYRQLAETTGCVHARRDVAHRVGVSVGDPEGGDSFIYHAGLVVAKGTEPPAGLTAMEVPGGVYAAYRHVGAYALIKAAYRLLFGSWLPTSGHELADRPLLELYRSPWAGANRAEHVTELMIPIKES